MFMAVFKNYIMHSVFRIWSLVLKEVGVSRSVGRWIDGWWLINEKTHTRFQYGCQISSGKNVQHT